MAEGLLDKANIILTPTGYKAGTMYNVAPIEQPYEDFDFARASVASRVNSSGLVEMVGRTLGSNLVQNGDFSEIGPDLVQNGTFDLGSELVTNGDFSDGLTGWNNNATLPVDYLSVVNNKLELENITGSTQVFTSDTFNVTSGKSYKISLDTIKESGVDDFDISLRNTALGTIVETITTTQQTGTLTYYFTSSSTQSILFQFTLRDTIKGSIDNVSVKEVDPNDYWSTTSTVTVKDGFANITSDGSYQYLRQLNIVEVGKSYKLTYEITRQGSGVLKSSSLGLNSIPSTVGTHTVYGLSSQTYIVIDRASACDIDITNIVVQELDPNDYWTLGTGWSIGDDEASSDGVSGNSNLYQENILTVGKTYKVSVDVTRNSGEVRFYITSDPTATITSSGTYTFYGVCDRTDLDFYIKSVYFDGSISNVVVQEVIDTNNIPRINYDSNGENGHWLLEPSRTNYATYSSDINEWNEIISNGTITSTSNYALAPNGENEATRLQLNSTTGYALKSVATTSFNDDYHISIYLKSNTTENQEVTIYGRNSLAISYTVTTQWQRFEVSCNNPLGSAFFNFGCRPSQGSDADLDILAWGGQLEQGTYTTSYIPTLTGSTETRATETATGAGSADLINSTEGVLYLEVAALANDDTSYRAIFINDGTNNNRVGIRFSNTTNQIQALSYKDTSLQGFGDYTLSNSEHFNKIAFKYKVNDFALWINGVEVATDTSGDVYTVGTLNNIDFSAIGGQDFYGKCKALAVFDEALLDDELEKLTSWSSFNAMATDLGYTIE